MLDARGMSARASTAAVRAAADRLRDARAQGWPCAPVRDLLTVDDIEGAYAVQRQYVVERVAEGRRVVGHKIGLTSSAVQAQLGVNRPDFGVLLDDMDVSGLDVIPMTGLLQPKVEAEVAFVLGEDLVNGPLDVNQIRAGVERAHPALEIVDSRIEGWDISFVDTVADNASSGLFVLGGLGVTLDDFEPVGAEMTMSLNGTPASTGSGADCLGDPLVALMWLARTTRELGDPLRAGQVILSGALGPMVTVVPGAHVSAHISGLGPVEATFSKKEAT